jgi:hypothetical protein
VYGYASGGTLFTAAAYFNGGDTINIIHQKVEGRNIKVEIGVSLKTFIRKRCSSLNNEYPAIQQSWKTYSREGVTLKPCKFSADA